MLIVTFQASQVGSWVDPFNVCFKVVLIQQSRYDFFKSTLLHRRLPIVDYQTRDNLLLHVFSSCLSGTVATSQLFVCRVTC